MEVNKNLSPFFRLHRFFAADDITGIDAPADLIHHYTEAANAAFISLTFLHTLFGDLLGNFFLCHRFLLSNTPNPPILKGGIGGINNLRSF